MSLLESLEMSVAAAQHLDDRDLGAVDALRFLARKIDAWDVISEWALRDADEQGGRPTVPQNDNVSISAFLKGCDALGLTPIGRKNIEAAKNPRKNDDDAKGAPGDDDSTSTTEPGRVSSIEARRARSGRPA